MFGSPPPPTEAWLVTLGIAAAVTLTGTEIVLVPLVAAMEAALVQVSVGLAKLQVQLPLVNGDASDGVTPVGIVSRTVIVPVVAAVPVFVTVSVYCAPDWPAVHGPFAVLAIPRLGAFTVVLI